MLKLADIKKNILSGSFLGKASCFLCDRIKVIVFCFFILLSAYCIYIWYAYAYNFQLSPEKKAKYLESKDREVTFNRKKFQLIVEGERKRAEEYEKKVESKKDIFGIK